MNQAPPQQTTNPEVLRPGALKDLALLPLIQKQYPADSSGPMEVIPEEAEITGLVNLFNNQFDLFVRARECQNARLMRLILSQAAMTPEMIEALAGREETMRLCQDWIPREELAEMERPIYNQQQNLPCNQPIQLLQSRQLQQ